MDEINLPITYRTATKNGRQLSGMEAKRKGMRGRRHEKKRPVFPWNNRRKPEGLLSTAPARVVPTDTHNYVAIPAPITDRCL